MTRLKRTLLLVSVLAIGGLAMTASPGDGAARSTKLSPRKAAKGEPTRFYNFDDLLIDGEFRKPATLYTRALKSPRFDRLLRLQKSFLGRLLETARYPSLRWLR